MKKRLALISTALLFLGIFTIGLGLLLPFIVSADAYWTDDQAKSLSQSQVELHDLLHSEQDGHTHADGTFHAHSHEANDPQIAAALVRYQQREKELKRATAWRDSGPVFLRTLGSLLTIAGAVGWFSNRSE